MSKASVFKMVGVGVVAQNKELSSKEVEITPTEWLPMHDGEMVSNPAKMTHKSKDVDGNESQGMVLIDQVIVATWMPGGSNRLTAPDVRRGVHVEIWATADADKYYWKTMGLDDNLHKKETIIIGISNTDDESITDLSPENMYWIEFSTHSKRLAFCSSKSDGEAYQHELFIDTENSEFVYTDDIGNFVNVKSKVNLIHLQNAKGAYVKIDQKDIKAFAPQDITGQATRNITLKAGKDVLIDAGVNLMMKGGTMATINGGGSFMQFTAANTILKTPQLLGSR